LRPCGAGAGHRSAHTEAKAKAKAEAVVVAFTPDPLLQVKVLRGTLVEPLQACLIAGHTVQMRDQLDQSRGNAMLRGVRLRA